MRSIDMESQGCVGMERGLRRPRLMLTRLDSAADRAGVAIILHKVSHARPGIISAD